MTEVYYRAHAYVCGNACVQRVDNDVGTVTFSWIYQHRPMGCRYAVAGYYSAAAHAEQVVVWDLFNVMHKLDGTFITPEPIAHHDTVDAAIMATAMRYNKEDETN